MKISLSISAAIVLAGCTSSPAQPPTGGFLSDYAQLESDGNDLRYIDEDLLANYQQYIVEPVQVYFYDSEGRSAADEAELQILADYLDTALREALVARNRIVAEPAPGVAHLRVALTDIATSPASMRTLPPERRSGLKLGGATMEAEVIDSWTGEQIGAVVQSQAGMSLSLSGVETWPDARKVLDGWVERFQARLDARETTTNGKGIDR